MHLTPPSSLHLLISENEDVLSNNNSSDKDDLSDEDEDTATAAANEDTDDADASNDLFPMAKMAPKKRGAAAGGRKAPPKKEKGNGYSVLLAVCSAISPASFWSRSANLYGAEHFGE